MNSLKKSVLAFLSLLDLLFNALLLFMMVSSLGSNTTGAAVNAALFAVMLLLSGGQIAYTYKTFKSSGRHHPLLQAFTLNLFINVGFVVFTLAENSARS